MATVAIMLLPWLALAVGAVIYLQAALQSMDHVVADPIIEMQSVSRLQVALLRLASVARPGETIDAASRRETFTILDGKVGVLFGELKALPFLTGNERRDLESAERNWLGVRSLYRQPSPEVAERINVGIDRTIENLDGINRHILLEIDEQLDAAGSTRAKLVLSIICLFLAATVVAVAIGLLMARSILRPVRALEQGARYFGEGNLSHRIASTHQDELGQLAATFNNMADQLQRQQSALSELSMRDALTGAYNRRELHRRLEEEINRSRRYRRPFSLLMLDCDHFKRINDTYGHQSGDEVLRQITAELITAVRSNDFVARYGGEEFAIILPETPLTGAMELAERIRARIERHAIAITVRENINVTASLGVASTEQVTTGDELIAKADEALYAAKRTGRNRVCGAR